MKKVIFRHMAFAGKSMIWAMALYVGVMLLFNWDEVKNARIGNPAVTIAAQQADAKANVSQAGTFKNVLILVKAICGITALGK